MVRTHKASQLQRVPRYTSYPTAVSFSENVTADHYVQWLQALQRSQALSLYFHLPFCRQLCWFCGCHTKVVHQYDPIKKYLALLETEIALVRNKLPDSPVSHIHFGGGSPTVVDAQDFRKFMAVLGSHFNLDVDTDIDVEMDPRTLDQEKVAAYADTGVTRASLGVQDFDDDVQQAINRIQPFPMVSSMLDTLRSHDIRKINIDLIYGLPKQTLDTIRETVEKTVTLDSDRISLFGYAHVPWMKKHQAMISEEHLPDASLRMEMFELATELLVAAGYVPIGLDHFAKPDDTLAMAAEAGTLQRNFQGYTTDSAEALVGFGVSAISSLPRGYAQNTSSLRNYRELLQSGEIPIARGVPVSEEDANRRRIIMSLMCNLRADVKEESYAEELQHLEPYMESSDTHYDHGVLTVDPDLRNQIRLIASVFDQYLSETPNVYSQAV